ncbi:MAG: baseplate J/gp47 family protein [Chitinophagales bacterium]
MRARTPYYDNGASQGERLLKALLPEYVKVDERDLSHLLTFTAQYSKLLNYYNLKNEIHRDWYPFLIRDISIFLATILSIDLEDIRKKNHQYINDIIRSNSRRNDKIAHLRIFFHSVVSIATLFNDWHIHLSKINTTLLSDVEGIELEIQNMIRFKLRTELHKLRSYDLGAAESESIGVSIDLSYEEFDKIWNIYAPSIQPRNIYDSEESSDFNVRIDKALKKVQLVYRSFFNALTSIVKSAEKYLNESLNQEQSHEPHTALLIAFLQIFKHNQNHLNTITERHLDLYYSKILHQKRKTWQPDQTIGKFIMADHIDNYVLKAGTRLQISRDALGYNPIYVTDSDLHISRASIASLRTMFISKSLLVGMGSSFRLISSIYAASIANSKDGIGTPFEDQKNRWWAPFGEEQLNKVEYERTMVHGDIGFVIASPMLFLSEGTRNIQVIFQFENESMGTFRKLINDISKNESMSMEDAFFKMFANSFDLYMSTEEGWYDVQKYEVLPPTNWTGNDLTFNFILSSAEPAIVANNPEVIPENYRTKWPLLKVVLNTDDFVYAYSFLRDMLLDSIVINVDVEDIRELEVYNNDGKISLAIPFVPFGGVPELGNYFVVGHEELVKKEVTDLRLKIEWQGLPYNFDAHYAAYEADMTNESFKIQVSALKNGRFIPEVSEKKDNLRLFKEYPTGNTDQLDSLRIVDDIDLSKLQFKPNYTFRIPDNFDHTSKDGFIKFELSEPEQAFGHTIYPVKFAEVVNENIPDVNTGFFSTKIQKKKKLKPLPKEPYTPMVKSMSLSYSATSEIVISPLKYSRDRFKTPENIFHIEPFGIVNTYSGGRTRSRSIVPQYNEDGYLYIGLEGLKPPQLLTLLFPMSESAKGSRFYDLLDIDWHFLQNNEWKKFTPEQIVVDTTDRFTTIGIVTLEIPREINKQNTILPNNLHWLRISVRGDVDILGKVLEIETQAVTATWVPDSETNPEIHLANPLMPFEPIELETILAEIAETTQPLGSFNGKTSEKDNEFYARISERLRHKNRAVTHWDYEHLILNAFPSIYQVKCLSHLTNPDFVTHGNLLFVVVPRMKHHATMALPTVNTSLLQDIKEYLQKNTTPFVNIEVRNPEYEKIKITCSVAFTEGNNNGQTLKRLNRDIKKFVCPWLFGEEAELELGGSVTKDNLLDFIEKCSYVAFVTKFSVVQVTKQIELYETEDTAISKQIAPVIYTSKPWAVIVPIDKHQISVIENYNYQAPEMSAMDTMMLDVDFVIRSEGESEEKENEEEESEVFYPEEAGFRGLLEAAEEQYILDIEID